MFEGREVKGLSKGRYDETFAGEDENFRTLTQVVAEKALTEKNAHMYYIRV